MVSSDPLLIFMHIDMTEAEADISRLQRVVNSATELMNRQLDTVKRNIRKTLTMLGTVVSLAKNVVKAMGVSLGPVWDTLLDIIFITAETIIQIAIAYTATPAGWPLYATLAAVALGLSIGNRINVMLGRDQYESQINSVIMALGNLQALTYTGFR